MLPRDLTGIVKGHRRDLRLYIPVAGRVLLRFCILDILYRDHLYTRSWASPRERPACSGFSLFRWRRRLHRLALLLQPATMPARLSHRLRPNRWLPILKVGEH